jgi:hypothetical protein
MIFSKTRFLGFALFFSLFSLRQISAQAPSLASIHRDMVYNTTGLGHAYELFDQNASTVFSPAHSNGFDVLPADVVLRLHPTGSNRLTQINFITAPGAKGNIEIFTGTPGNWQAMSTSAMQYGNGITGLAWYPNMDNVRFIKIVFSRVPGDQAAFKTGEFSFTLSGTYAYTDQDACVGGAANCRTSKHTFDQYLGVNNFVGKTQLVNQFAPFAVVREYLPWDHVQGHMLSGNSTYGEDHLFRFSTAFPGYDLDRHYANLAGAGKEVLLDFKESSPFQMYFDYNGGQSTTLNQLGLSYNQLGGSYLELMERKPGRPAGGVQPNSTGFSVPGTYADHSDALFQASLRFGSGGDISKARFSDNAAKANQNTIKWIENWNEQDKWWSQPNVQAPVDPSKEKRLAYFSPKEYMAMTYSDYHPTDGQLAAPMVMSGLAELDVEYLKGMYLTWWELTKNEPGNLNWPFHAINYHHYSVNNWQHGIAPEKDPFVQGADANSPLARISGFVNKYLNNSELWLTEFGYSDHPQDITAARANYPNQDNEEVQADWIIRSYLHYYRYGIDKAFAYQLVDDGPNQWAGVFNHTGMIDRTDTGGGAPEYRYKKAWYYTYTLKQYLEGMKFDTESNAQTDQGRPVRRYDFVSSNGQKNISALWIPDDTNPAPGTLRLATNGHQKAQIVRFAYEKINGISEQVIDTDNDGYIQIQGIAEKPILIIWDTIQQVAECGCALDFSLKSGNSAAFQAIFDTKSTMLASAHPKCNYGPEGGTQWDSYQAETLTLNLGGGSETDLYQVDAIYANDPAWNSGDVRFELLDTAGVTTKTWIYGFDGQPMYPYNTQGAAYVWKTFDGIKTTAASLRIIKPAQVKIGEIIICGKSLGASNPNLPPVTPPVLPPVVPPVVPPVPPIPPVTPTGPQAPTTIPVACECAPFPVVPVSARYELAAGQIVPTSNTLFSACLDVVPDKSPARMFDEQNPSVLGMICSSNYDLLGAAPDYTDCTNASQSGYPIREWFPGWSNQYPYKAIIDFQQPVEFYNMFMYDSNDEGQISIEYRADTTHAWKTISLNGSKTISTNQYRKWRQISQSNDLLSAKQLRVTMYSQSARFSELAFCGPKDVRKNPKLEASISTDQSTEPSEIVTEEERLRQISHPSQANPTTLASEQWSVFPNPADKFVEVQGIPLGVTTLVLQDMTGRTMATYPAPAFGNHLVIPVSQYPSGVYILAAKAGDALIMMERVLVK